MAHLFIEGDLCCWRKRSRIKVDFLVMFYFNCVITLVIPKTASKLNLYNNKRRYYIRSTLVVYWGNVLAKCLVLWTTLLA